MNAMVEARRRMTVLAALTSGQKLTQRSLASELDISLGLANGLLRGMEAEGLISVTRSAGQRATAYETTATGQRELGRLCALLAHESCRLLDPIRAEMQSRFNDLATKGSHSVLLCGNGVFSDMAASAVLNAGMKLAGVVAEDPESDQVAGWNVRPLSDTRKIKCDAVAALTQGDAQLLRRHLDKRVPVVIVGPDSSDRRPPRDK